jgi:hypothetical protein
VDENADGIAKGVKGIHWEAMLLKNLCTVCARLGFKARLQEPTKFAVSTLL